MLSNSRSLIEIQRNYLQGICKSIDGLKCMIFDKHSSQLISLNFLQSEGFEMEVFLFEDISNVQNEKMNYVSAIFILTHPAESLRFFQQELKNPNFKDYHLYFLSDIADDVVRRFAEYDEQDLIKTFQRIFCNYFAINNEFFHSNISMSQSLLYKGFDQWTNKEQDFFTQIHESLLSCLCSLRLKPQIRFLKGSRVSEQLADRLNSSLKRMSTSGNEFRNTEAQLLIFDRKEDPFTPLIIGWTYQTLLHEFLGIQLNKVVSKGKEYNLNQQFDEFYSKNLFSNYGELAKNLQKQMEKINQERESYKNISKIEEMQRMLSSIQSFQKEQALTQ